MNNKNYRSNHSATNRGLGLIPNLLVARPAALFIALLFVLLTSWAWVGFLGSDDVTYATGAYGWIEEFPYVGGHGTIRYTITIPMALSFLAFGGNEVAMVLPSYLAILILFYSVWNSIRKMESLFSSNLTLLLLVTTPLLVIQSTIASIDIIEALFLFSSFFLFWKYTQGDRKTCYLVFSGIFAGLAFLTRETAIFVVPFFGILFLSGYRFPRKYYLLIVVGFVTAWLVEICYLWAMTGDPLYRINISLNHDSTIDRSIDVAGNFIIHPAVDPLLVLLVNQEFMLLFWLGIPLSVWICFFEKRETEVRRFARLLALFGLVWFLAVAAAVNLLPLNPRYFMITTISMVAVSGLALGQIGQYYHKKLILVAIVCIMLSLNWVGIYVENKDSLFGERQYAQLVSAHLEPIYTDPMTRYRSDLLLKWNVGRERALADVPPSGSLFYYNPAHTDNPNRFMDSAAQSSFQPGSDWKIVGEYRPAPGTIAGAMEKIGLNKLLPRNLWNKLMHRYPKTILYRVGI